MQPACPEPQSPRLRQNDVTVEKVATLLATASPKGLLIVRDELAGWILGFNNYNRSGRAFWIEAYGGRPYRVERQSSPTPIIVPRLAVSVTGTTQPDRLATIFNQADDGLLSRFLWAWPDALPFRLGRAVPAAAWAIEALDRLRLLELSPGSPSEPAAAPVLVPLVPEASPLMEVFGQRMQSQQNESGRLMGSSLAKARGLALRLSLVLEMLWWCGTEGMAAPPPVITEKAFAAACSLVSDYFMPMAERVYGDAAKTPTQRNATTLARWIIRAQATEVYVRHLLREVRLPGLHTAEHVHAAAKVLVDGGWLTPPGQGGFQARARAAYAVNARCFELLLGAPEHSTRPD